MTHEELKAAIMQPVKQCTAEEALQTLKAERFARWQSAMTVEEYTDITAAHEFCIKMLAEIVHKKESESVQKITWKETGVEEFESSDGRFQIIYTDAPLNGGHWQMVDKAEENYFAAINAYSSLEEAKEAAEKLVKESKK